MRVLDTLNTNRDWPTFAGVAGVLSLVTEITNLPFEETKQMNLLTIVTSLPFWARELSLLKLTDIKATTQDVIDSKTNTDPITSRRTYSKTVILKNYYEENFLVKSNCIGSVFGN